MIRPRQRNYRHAHIEGVAGRPAAGIREGIERDVHIGVFAQILPRQRTQGQPLRHDPRPGDPLQGAAHALRQARRIVNAVGSRQRQEHLVTACLDAAAGPVLGDRRGRLPTQLGVGDITQPQLEPGPDHVPHLGTQVGPSLGANHQVHAVGQCPRHHRLDALVQVVEVGPERPPAVDHEEHVPVAVIEAALRPPRTIGADRVDAVDAEVPLPVLYDPLDLREHSVDDLRAVARGHARHVGGPVEGREGAPAQVQNVELHLLRRVSQAQRHHQTAQRRRLARQRPPDHHHVAVGP